MQTADKFFNQYGGYIREEMLARSIEFAKLHVKEALEAAANNAETYDSSVGYDEYISVNKASIINSYPLTNIK